jgi:hypothetical protein
MTGHWKQSLFTPQVRPSFRVANQHAKRWIGMDAKLPSQLLAAIIRDSTRVCLHARFLEPARQPCVAGPPNILHWYKLPCIRNRTNGTATHGFSRPRAPACHADLRGALRKLPPAVVGPASRKSTVGDGREISTANQQTLVGTSNHHHGRASCLHVMSGMGEGGFSFFAPPKMVGCMALSRHWGAPQGRDLEKWFDFSLSRGLRLIRRCGAPFS